MIRDDAPWIREEITAQRKAREIERRDIATERARLLRQDRLTQAQLTALVLREEELFDEEDGEWNDYTAPKLRAAGLLR